MKQNPTPLPAMKNSVPHWHWLFSSIPRSRTADSVAQKSFMDGTGILGDRLLPTEDSLALQPRHPTMALAAPQWGQRGAGVWRQPADSGPGRPSLRQGPCPHYWRSLRCRFLGRQTITLMMSLKTFMRVNYQMLSMNSGPEKLLKNASSHLPAPLCLLVEHLRASSCVNFVMFSSILSPKWNNFPHFIFLAFILLLF